MRAAQAAAEEATRAAAEEAARQAAEQQRLADEAAIRAQNLAMQRASAEQAQMGPSPEVLARIQKELAEVRSPYESYPTGRRSWIFGINDQTAHK